MSDNFTSRSFLFEIIDINSSKIEQSFTLVLPPNSYQIKEPHRVNITKTFGNAWVDDYGPDNIQLTIKGISGTAHAFPTFRTTGASANDETRIRDVGEAAGSSSGYRHREAFYAFRDEIMRYRDRQNFDQKELRVYDLYDEQVYKCILLEFTLDRNADKPFWYPFTISLFVYSKNSSDQLAKAVKIAKDPIQSLDNIDEASKSLDERFKVFDNVQSIRNQVALFANQAALLRARFNTWLTRTRNVIESPLLVTKQLIDIGTDLLGIVYDAYSQGKLSYETWINAEETIQNQIRESLAIYGFSIQEGFQQSKVEQVERRTGFDYSDPSNPSPTVNSESFSFSGVNLYTVRGGDSLQSIAQEQLGDSNLWVYIASINPDISTSADLVVGNEIFVPVQTQSVNNNKDNYIITEDTSRDPYGSDIRLDSNGNIVLQESNDVSLTSGVENVLQAIDLRLKTQVGSMITQTAYGLAAQPGLAGTAQALSYVRMGLKDALLRDPRISQVKNIKVGIERDQISISTDLVLVGREQSLPVSVLLN